MHCVSGGTLGLHHRKQINPVTFSMDVSIQKLSFGIKLCKVVS